MKQIILAIIHRYNFWIVHQGFCKTNQNPNQISDELLKQDFNLVGSPISGMILQSKWRPD